MAGSFNLNFRLKYCNPVIELAKFRNIEIPQSCDGKFQIRENMTRRFLNFFLTECMTALLCAIHLLHDASKTQKKISVKQTGTVISFMKVDQLICL